MSKAVKRKDKAAKKVEFPNRMCVRLDDDVLGLLRTVPIKWKTQAHPINAALRRALGHLAPQLRIQETTFDAIALDGPPPIARTLNKHTK